MIIMAGGLGQGRTTSKSRENPQLLGFGKDELEFAAPVDVEVEVVKMGFDVYVDAKIKTTVMLECGRCLEKFPYELEAESKMLFVPAKEGQREVTAEDGVFLYREVIDLADRIAEAIREALPMKPLCRPDCKGLCTRCGQNLNEGECSCEQEDESYHPFKGLKLK